VSIDKTKGIVCKPMPKYWYDYHAIEKPTTDDPEELARYELNKRIVADKKPYFMRYVYPALMKEYKTYVKDAERKARLKFNMTLDELRKSADETGDPQQCQFIDVYDHKMPVNTNNCTMNRICRRIEALTADISFNIHSGDFDYSLMKCGTHYPIGQYYSIKKLYAEYVSKAKELAAAQTNRVISKDTSLEYSAALNEYFRREAEAICPNEDALVDIMLDLCYTHENSKQFLWNLKGNYIVCRLTEANGGKLHYPIQDPDGDFEYGGDSFSMTAVEVATDA